MLLDEMEIFYYVVELKSFSKAAVRLGKSKAFVSKKVTHLEQHLKLRLLSRDTRKLTLTEAGRNFFLACANVMAESKKIYASLQELQLQPSGKLKISMPPALGLNLISPILPQFLKQYPQINLDIQLESRLVDLIQEGYDLVLRSAKLTSSNLTAQRILTINSVIVATPNYFKNYGMPQKPHDLSRHHFAVYSGVKNSGIIKLHKNNKEYVIEISASLSCNQMDLIKQVLLNDSFIGILPDFMITKELQQKRLISCLADYVLPLQPIYAIYPEREFMAPKLKVFLELLKDHLK